MAFKYLIVIAVLIVPILSKGDGAPNDDKTCKSLTPQHGVDFQESAANYTIKFRGKSIKAGGKIRIVLSGNTDSDTLTGFILQARAPNSEEAIGSWEIENSNLIRLMNCGGKSDNSVTHAKPLKEKTISAIWRAPADVSEVVFKATAAYTGFVFWRVESAKLLVQ